MQLTNKQLKSLNSLTKNWKDGCHMYSSGQNVVVVREGGDRWEIMKTGRVCSA